MVTASQKLFGTLITTAFETPSSYVSSDAHTYYDQVSHAMNDSMHLVCA